MLASFIGRCLITPYYIRILNGPQVEGPIVADTGFPAFHSQSDLTENIGHVPIKSSSHSFLFNGFSQFLFKMKTALLLLFLIIKETLLQTIPKSIKREWKSPSRPSPERPLLTFWFLFFSFFNVYLFLFIFDCIGC